MTRAKKVASRPPKQGQTEASTLGTAAMVDWPILAQLRLEEVIRGMLQIGN